MGNLFGKEPFSRNNSFSEVFKLKDVYTTKERTTLWQYDENQTTKSISLGKNSKVKILDCSTKWWHVKYKKDTGYA